MCPWTLLPIAVAARQHHTTFAAQRATSAHAALTKPSSACRGEYGRLGLNDPKGAAQVRPRLVPGLASHRIIQAACGGSHTMALSDEGQLFTWGRCSSGRQGFHAPATVELPQQLQLPGGAERWHPICIAAGGRHSMCMALPRHTVTDHARRLTEMSADGLSPAASLQGQVAGRSPGVPIRAPRRLRVRGALPACALRRRVERHSDILCRQNDSACVLDVELTGARATCPGRSASLLPIDQSRLLAECHCVH